MNDFIYGIDETKNIVSCEVLTDNCIELFLETEEGVTSEFIENYYWLLSPVRIDSSWQQLQGSLYYRYMKRYQDREHFLRDKGRYRSKEVYSVYDNKEAAMMLGGFTYFKGLKVKDVSVLSFDIETTGIEHNADSKVLLISNTFRRNGKIVKKLFCHDDYITQAELLDAWCKWVCEVNPSVITGHNIYSYDLPYMNYCAQACGIVLLLGRDDSAIVFDKKESKFRKDGSQFYDYKRAHIYGREIIDTMFLSIKYDIARKYESYRLKHIVQVEGLEKKDRTFYDASLIRKNHTIPEEWEKIKAYARDDADDALALYDLMIAPYFYLTQSVPKSFQSMLLSAPGSQINSFLVRSYLQDGHSLPKATEAKDFTGALSWGTPGIYRNVWKQDVASLYPSIMLEYGIYDKHKDPKAHFQKMVKHFTAERLKNKAIAKQTGDAYYKDLEQSQKIVCNSCYGLLGAPGLLFNSPLLAAQVTKKGREILEKAVFWATGKNLDEIKKLSEPLLDNEDNMDKQGLGIEPAL